MFYNTVGLTGRELRESWSRSVSQKETVLELFNKYGGMTPMEVLRRLNNDLDTTYIITSVRRCITDLTKEGKLEKTSETKKEVYGMINYVWKAK